MISQRCLTSYSIWNQLRKDAEKEEPGSSMKVMVYKNVNRRVLLLAAAKYIEEIKHAEKLPHGRIEYRLTIKGVRELLPYAFSLDQSGTGNIIDHVDSFELDKNEFGVILIEMINDRITGIDNLVGVAISANIFDTSNSITIIKKLQSLRQQIEDLKKERRNLPNTKK
ncbi:MAG: hypothetical protein ACRD8W_03370 [Nitrososphaeraceae archaeon]